MNLSKFKSIALACLLTLIVSGCDSIPFIDSTSDYKSAGRSRPLEVPPDLTSISSSDTFTVPGGATTYSDFSKDQTEAQEVKEKVLPTSDNVRFVRAGSERWLVVKAPPEKVWPVVRDFWTDLGFAVRLENAQTGIMETEWADPKGLNAANTKGTFMEKFDTYIDKLNGLQRKQKFRTRIDRGSEEETTEIYLSHRSITVNDDQKNRVLTPYGVIDTGYKSEKQIKSEQDRATEEDIDAELLRRLMVKLGVEEQRSHTIIASPVAENHATLNKESDGALNLTLNDPFDRGWRRTGLALDRIGFVVEDKDRSSGLFFVRYSDVDIDDTPEKKKGLLDKLKFWGDDDKQEEQPAPKKEDDTGVLDKLKFWEAKKDKVDPSTQYRIKVESYNDGSKITVTDKNGKRDRSNTANRIINLLYEQLK